jgi:hypothetical protein
MDVPESPTIDESQTLRDAETFEPYQVPSDR